MSNVVTAILLAGSRPGRDPLLDGSGATAKALLPVGGAPMMSHPLAALRGTPEIGRVIVYANDPGVVSEVSDSARPAELRPAETSIARTIERALHEFDGPLLVTTADHVLLTSAMLRHFVARSQGCDIAAAMVERGVVERAGHNTQRTWLSFRGGKWSGANLFWLSGPACLPLIRLWSGIEQDRKKGRKIIAAFGVVNALAAALRLATIHQLARRVGRRFGLDARIVAMPQAEACIDADKPDDVALIERILAEHRP